MNALTFLIILGLLLGPNCPGGVCPPPGTEPPSVITEPPSVTEQTGTEEPSKTRVPPVETLPPGIVETTEPGTTPQPHGTKGEPRVVHLPDSGYGPQEQAPNLPLLLATLCAVGLALLLVGALVFAWANKETRGLDPEEMDEWE